MCLLTWRCWKLKRKAISSNDAEVQSARTTPRYKPWSNPRITTSGCDFFGANFMASPSTSTATPTRSLPAKRWSSFVKGVVTTDSRSGYDAVTRHESPMLGLSNTRAALQAFQVREMRRFSCKTVASKATNCSNTIWGSIGNCCRPDPRPLGPQ